MMWAEFFFK